MPAALDKEIGSEKFFVSDDAIRKADMRKNKLEVVRRKFGDSLFTASSQINFLVALRHTVAIAESSGIISLFNLSSGNVTVLRGHKAPVVCICAISDDLILSTSWDKTMRVWDIEVRLQITY